MRRRLYSAEEFSNLSEREQRDSETGVVAMASVGAPQFDSDEERTVSYVFSTPAVGRDKHSVAADAWQPASHRARPGLPLPQRALH